MKTFFQTSNTESGFSIVEFLVSMAILGIIAAIAIPNLLAFKQNSDLNSATRELFSGFQQAKMTAIKRNINCTITFGKNRGTTYDYIVFVDHNRNFKRDSNDEIIISRNLEKFLEIDYTNFPFNINEDGNPSIAFNPHGLPKDKNGVLGQGRVPLKNTATQRTKNVELNAVGNVKITS